MRAYRIHTHFFYLALSLLSLLLLMFTCLALLGISMFFFLLPLSAVTVVYAWKLCYSHRQRCCHQQHGSFEIHHAHTIRAHFLCGVYKNATEIEKQQQQQNTARKKYVLFSQQQQ